MAGLSSATRMRTTLKSPLSLVFCICRQSSVLLSAWLRSGPLFGDYCLQESRNNTLQTLLISKLADSKWAGHLRGTRSPMQAESRPRARYLTKARESPSRSENLGDAVPQSVES